MNSYIRPIEYWYGMILPAKSVEHTGMVKIDQYNN